VAAFFALADEVTIEPELIDRWRHSARVAREPEPADPDEVTRLRHTTVASNDDDDDDDDDEDDDADGRTSGSGADVIELRPRVDADADAISHLLRAPAGASPPSFPDVDELDHGPIRNRQFADVLDDALDHLAIRWE
jgi:hypothetical protein